MNRSMMYKTLRRHEGIRLKPYLDTENRWTIGVGRNLTDKGITDQEAEFLLRNDMEDAIDDARAVFPAFDSLDDLRQEALVNMAFNLGRARLLKFEKFFDALTVGDWGLASAEMLRSRWAKQVGARANELAGMILHGSGDTA